MALPSFSLKQLLVSVLWISIGFGGITFSVRDWNLSLSQTDDWLVNIQPIVRITARVVGWTFVCIGFIPLVTTRPPTKVLILTLCGGIPGNIVGAVVREAALPIGYSRSSDQIIARVADAIPWLGMALGSVVVLVVVALAGVWKPTERKIPD